MNLQQHTGRLGVCAAVLCATGLAHVRAGDDTWSATPADGAWQNSANWVGGTPPGATATTTNPDTATFNGASTTLAITPDAGRNVKNITFSGTASKYAIGTTGGNPLALTTDGMVANSATVTGTNRVDAPLVLQGDPGAYTFRNNAATTSTRLLAAGGGITGAATSPNSTVLTLDGSNTGGNSLEGSLGDGAGGGTLAVVKSGAGRWNLAGANSHSGGTTLDAGSLAVYTPTSLGSGTFTINGGRIIGPNANLTLANNPMVWNGSFTNVVTFQRPLNMGTGAVTLNADVNIVGTAGNYTTLFTVGGPISDGANTHSLSFASPVSHPDGLALAGNNTFKGGFTLHSGTVRISHTNCFGVGALTINGGGLSQNAAGPLTGVTGQTWTASFNLSATAGGINLGTSPVNVTAGTKTIQLDNGSATFGGGISGAGAALVFKGTGYAGNFNVNGTNTFDGGLTLLPGTANTMQLNMGTPYALGTGPFTISQGGAQGVRLDNTSGAPMTNAYNNAMVWSRHFFTFWGTRNLGLGTGTITLATNVTVSVEKNTLSIGGAIAQIDDTPRSLTKIGGGTNLISGAGTYAGGTVVTNGLLVAEVGGVLGTGPVTVNPRGTVALTHSSAIADDAAVTLTRLGTTYGRMDLAAGVVERVGSVSLDGTVYDTPGTSFGAEGTGATVQDSNFFSGTGILKITSPTSTVVVIR